jgi:uncharacterized protein
MVRVDTGDITAIAAWLGIPEKDFIEKFTRLRPSREGLALVENPDGTCVFLEGANHCLIEPVKPRQCAGFPNTWSFDGCQDLCQAVLTPC